MDCFQKKKNGSEVEWVGKTKKGLLQNNYEIFY